MMPIGEGVLFGGGNGLIPALLLGLLFVTLFVIMISPSIRDWILRLLERLLHDLAELLGWNKKYRHKKDSAEERFVDTVENLTRRTQKHGGLPSRAAFERQLSRMADPVEQYTYAYSVYATYLENTHGSVIVSDTPRERSDKVRTDDRYPDAVPFSALYEQLRYADDPQGQADLQQRIHDISTYLKQVLS